MSKEEARGRLGADTGGTFTDLVRWNGVTGRLETHKILSSPDDPSRAIARGIDEMGDKMAGLAEVIHGTTVATNALLERRGAKVGLVTTAGFEDILWLGRQRRPELYRFEVQGLVPVVEEPHVIGVEERVGSGGEVLQELDEEEIERAVDEMEAMGVEAVVICLLHAYANRGPEQRLAKAFRARKRRWHVTASSEVSATLREYERMSTTAINGYVGPVMDHYLERLEERLDGVGRLDILQSQGGRCSAEMAARQPVQTVLSGPAGGVVGALKAAGEVGREAIITFDMGGTSTDVSLAPGEPLLTEEGSIAGMPLQVPIVDIHTVGAGGGSVARVDRGGALRVGPESAGAEPGPAAYGRGGKAATVTDAHVVLGTLPEGYFLGGEMNLDREAAREAVRGVADALERGVEETAQAILEVADAAMVRAIKVISVHRGQDPRDYALVAFGGAGGLHGCRLAQRLEMDEVIIPRHAGLCSAMGMLQARPMRMYSQSVLLKLGELASGRGRRRLQSVEKRWAETARSQMGSKGLEMEWTASLRYVGQSFSLDLVLGSQLDGSDWERVEEIFHGRHEEAYGYCDRDLEVEVVRCRLQVYRSLDVEECAGSASEADENRDRAQAPVSPVARRQIDLGHGPVEVALYEREAIEEGQRIEGPAIVSEYSGTVVVLRGWEVVQRSQHLVLRRGERGAVHEGL